MDWEVMVKEKGPAIKQLKRAQAHRGTWDVPKASQGNGEKGGPRLPEFNEELG